MSFKRIISLAPSVTETLFFLKLGHKIIGVTEQCGRMEEAKSKERIGSFVHPDIEKIVSLKPDLVIAYKRIHKRFSDELKRRNITVLILGPAAVKEIFNDMEKIGNIAGSKSSTKSLVNQLRKRVDGVKRKISGRTLPRVFRLMSSEPITCPSPYSYQYDAIIVAGGKPMPFEVKEAYTRVLLEEVIRFNPGVIVSCGINRGENPKPRCKGCKRERPMCQRVVEDIKGWEGWKDISAVREGRIFSLPCEFICRPGPRIVDGIEKMARFFHPEVF